MQTENRNPMNASLSEMPAWLPAKFWDGENNQVRMEQLAQSYQELERQLSAPSRGIIPKDPASYEILIDDDLLEVDEDVNRRLYDKGFSQDQAQLVYDLAKERLMPMVQQIAAQFEDAREQDRLHQHFGGAERFEAIRPQLRAWGEANLPPSVFENLVASAEGVIAMAEMMKSREPSLSRNSEITSGASELDLKRMMKDPRYWKERDPAYVKRVREGFRNLYPGD
ncbi:MAG: hypothetical protein OQK24_04235 [Magnetovibrio sp.]|nr:hypothetical protein [Magnetovibrio sp.]